MGLAWRQDTQLKGRPRQDGGLVKAPIQQSVGVPVSAHMGVEVKRRQNPYGHLPSGLWIWVRVGMVGLTVAVPGYKLHEYDGILPTPLTLSGGAILLCDSLAWPVSHAQGHDILDLF